LIALSEGIVLEEAVDLSSDRLLMNEYVKIFSKDMAHQCNMCCLHLIVKPTFNASIPKRAEKLNVIDVRESFVDANDLYN
jgi:hypothetical protein